MHAPIAEYDQPGSPACKRGQSTDGQEEECKKASAKSTPGLKDGAKCKVVGGTHQGKSGVVRDINTSATGYVTITVVQANGERFKTLAKNVVMEGK